MNFYDVNIRNYNFSIRHASKNPTQDLLCSFDGTKASHFLSHRVIFLFEWSKVPFFEISKYLTVTVRAGRRLPKSSKMLITAEMSTIAQKWLKRLPLKFKDESFGAIQMFQKFFRRKFHRK